MIADNELYGALDTVNSRIEDAGSPSKDLEILGFDPSAVKGFAALTAKQSAIEDEHPIVAAYIAAMLGIHAGILLGRGMVDG